MAVFDSQEYSRTLLAGLQLMQHAFENANQMEMARQKMDQEIADNKRAFALREESLRLQETNLALKAQIEQRRATESRAKLAGEAVNFDRIETADQWKDAVRIRDQRMEDVATQATLDPSDPTLPRDLTGQVRLDQKFAGMGLKEINRYEEGINARLAQYGDIAAQLRNPEAKALREKYQQEGPALQAQRDFITHKIVADPVLQEMNRKINAAQNRFVGQPAGGPIPAAPRPGATSAAATAVGPATALHAGPAGTQPYADLLAGADILAAYDEASPQFASAADQMADRLFAAMGRLPADQGVQLGQEFERRMAEKGAALKVAVITAKLKEKLNARKSQSK